MGYCPALLLENLEFLFSAGKNRGLLARQRQIRKEIQAELGEKVRNVTEEGESGR